MRRLLWLVVCVGAVACGPTSPSSTEPLSGVWRGTIEGNPTGPGTLRMDITQRGSALSGSWSVTFPGQNSSDSGQMTGAVNGSAVSMTLGGGTTLNCRASFEGTLTGTTVRGTFATIDCVPAVGGSFSMVRQ